MRCSRQEFVRYITFKEADTWYAACLEFNIVESGSSPQEAMLLLIETLRGYAESAQNIGIRIRILKQKVDDEYEVIWKELQTDGSLSRLSIFSFGQYSLAGLLV